MGSRYGLALRRTATAAIATTTTAITAIIPPKSAVLDRPRICSMFPAEPGEAELMLRGIVVECDSEPLVSITVRV